VQRSGHASDEKAYECVFPRGFSFNLVVFHVCPYKCLHKEIVKTCARDSNTEVVS
jgi:hypothetical protein